jgi:hypothetical protein
MERVCPKLTCSATLSVEPNWAWPYRESTWPRISSLPTDSVLDKTVGSYTERVLPKYTASKTEREDPNSTIFCTESVVLK